MCERACNNSYHRSSSSGSSRERGDKGDVASTREKGEQRFNPRVFVCACVSERTHDQGKREREGLRVTRHLFAQQQPSSSSGRSACYDDVDDEDVGGRRERGRERE